MEYPRLHRIDTGKITIIYEGESIENRNEYRGAVNNICKNDSIAVQIELLRVCILLEEIVNVKMVEIRNSKLLISDEKALYLLLGNEKFENLQKLQFFNVRHSKLSEKQLISVISKSVRGYVVHFIIIVIVDLDHIYN